MKKKVLFLMPALVGGGAEKVLVDVLRHFDYSKYDLTLFLEFYEGVYLNDIPAEVGVISLHGKNNLWFQRLHRRLAGCHLLATFYYWIYRLLFLWMLRGKRFDVAISFMEGSAVRFHSYIFHKAKKHLSWIHIDLLRKHWSLDFFKNETEEASIYNMMDKVVFVSNDARRSFLKMYPVVEASRCCVQYNLIDVENIRQTAGCMRVDKNKLTICMSGRLNRQKRYDRAVDVARLLDDAGYDFELWILGDGELRPMIEQRIQDYGLEHKVLLKGFVKPPYSYMLQSDIFLNTSEAEGFSLVIAEAFCLGIPVVATKTTGPSELIGNSEYGLLVDEDETAIYEGLKFMIDNDIVRKMYREKALERSKIFQVEETMRQLYVSIS